MYTRISKRSAYLEIIRTSICIISFILLLIITIKYFTPIRETEENHNNLFNTISHQDSKKKSSFCGHTAVLTPNGNIIAIGCSITNSVRVYNTKTHILIGEPIVIVGVIGYSITIDATGSRIGLGYVYNDELYICFYDNIMSRWIKGSSLHVPVIDEFEYNIKLNSSGDVFALAFKTAHDTNVQVYSMKEDIRPMGSLMKLCYLTQTGCPLVLNEIGDVLLTVEGETEITLKMHKWIPDKDEWIFCDDLIGTDLFAHSISISSTLIALGDNNVVRVYDISSHKFVQVGDEINGFRDTDGGGTCVGISATKESLVFSDAMGNICVHVRTSNKWQQTSRIKPCDSYDCDDMVGYALALSTDGSHVAVCHGIMCVDIYQI